MTDEIFRFKRVQRSWLSPRSKQKVFSSTWIGYVTGIIDSREQEDGCIFDERVIDSKLEDYEDKALFIQGEWERRCEKRRESLGYEIQPIKKLEEGQEQMSVDIQPRT
jgi:hypothetical protein